MGIDLRIHPLDTLRINDGKWWGFAHSTLELGRAGDLISDLEPWARDDDA